MKVGYLGPEDSYSHLAAKTFRKDAELIPYPSFRRLFIALEEGECDYIAVPIENSLNGGVLQNIDLLQAYQNVIATEEITIKIDNRLITQKGAKKEDIKRIYSHQQALAQCERYLAENFPGAELIASPSTTAGLKFIVDGTVAGIVGSHVNVGGLYMSPQNVADEEINLTHFLLVERGSKKEGVHSDKVFFSATCRHKPGELTNLLLILRDGGLNMTKIESRPIKEKPGEYRFFIELDGDIADIKVQKVLSSVKSASNSFKLLGYYK